MNSKRKLLISMLAIVFVLLAVVATVAIAFALTQQTITTTLNIGYVVEDIDGTASATYTIGGVTESLTAKKGNQVIGDTLVFHAGDTEDAGNLMFPEGQIPLSAQNDNIVIQYTYSNTGAKHYIASMSFDSELVADNMKVEYSIDGTTYSENRYAVVVPANTNNKSYWIRISIDNKAKSASFTGDFNWLLSGCDEQSESYLSLTSLEFTGSNGSYSASVASEGEYAGALVFPSSVNGDPVTTISSSSMTQAEKNQVTSVYIPDSVTTIGDYAFYNYQNLQTVTFEQNETAGASAQSGTGLTSIGGDAFSGCTGLTSIELPTTLTELASTAFSGCSGLTSIEIPSSVTNIGYYAFSGCTGLTSITISSGVTSIERGVFQNCTGLTSIKIPAGVTSIGSYAFAGCSSLKYLTVPANIHEIGEYAFGGETIDTVITLDEIIVLDSTGDGVVHHIWSSYPSANNIILKVAEGVTSISTSGAYEGAPITQLILPSTLVEISGVSVFSNCTGLSSVVIPASVTKIGFAAFVGTGITDVEFENPNGWSVYNDYVSPAVTTQLSASDLADNAIAASYLTTNEAYAGVGRLWTRT